MPPSGKSQVNVVGGRCRQETSEICQLSQRGKCHQWATGNVDMGPGGQQRNGEGSQQGTGGGDQYMGTRMKMSNTRVPTWKQPTPIFSEVEVVETPAAV